MSGDGARRQVGQVGAGRQVQLAESLPEVPREGKHCEVLTRGEEPVTFRWPATRRPKDGTHPDVDAASEVQGVQLCSGGAGAV